MTFEMPLFPLDVVLFPGMQLPLHIFEPRYRLMANRCLEADATFGVTLIVAGVEGQSGTFPASIGCAAHIVESTPFSDGRLNLMTVGGRRFQVLSLREEDDYWIGTCQWIDDESDATEDDSIDERAARVRRALNGYLASLARNANLSPADVAGLDVPADAYDLSMWIAALITLPNDQKQELLAMTSTAARLEIEHVFLRRGEIVQRAYARKSRDGQNTQSDEDDFAGPFSQFLSLN